MSLIDEIKARIRQQIGVKLFLLPTLLPGSRAKRELFVSNEVKECVAGKMNQRWEGYRCAQLRARLDAFTLGYQFTIGQDPSNKSSDAMLARTHPTKDRIWSIRSTEPKPGIRCFGAFGGKDLFIALTWEFREDINSARDWKYEIDRCKASWSDIFGSTPRLHKGSLDEYITGFRSV